MAEPLMSGLVTAGMVLASLVGVVCVLLERPRRPATVAGGVVMAAAMADMALGHALLPPAAWAAILVAAGLAVVSTSGRRRAGHTWSQGLCLALAAGMVVAAHRAGTSAAERMSTAMPAMPGMPGMDAELVAPRTLGSSPVLLSGALLLGYLVFLGWRAVARRRAAGALGTQARRPRRSTVHDVAMTCCLVLMAAMPAVPM